MVTASSTAPSSRRIMMLLKGGLMLQMPPLPLTCHQLPLLDSMRCGHKAEHYLTQAAYPPFFFFAKRCMHLTRDGFSQTEQLQFFS